MRENKRVLVMTHNLWLGYGGNVILRDVELCVCAGDFIGLVGPNGSGKTTLLRALLGTLKPMQGSIVWHVPKDEVRIGYVPQRELLDELYPLNAIDITLMSRINPKKPWRKYSSEDFERAMWALEQLNIADVATKPYRLLSGGQRQKVLIARAIAAEPNFLILDEPTNGLDLPTEYAIMELIARLHNEYSMTIIFVTHLLNVIVNYATKIGIIHNGKADIGSTSDMISPEKLREAYGVEASIATFGGKRMIFVRGNTS